MRERRGDRSLSMVKRRMSEGAPRMLQIESARHTRTLINTRRIACQPQHRNLRQGRMPRREREGAKRM